jgi:hypothetical protein
LENGAVLFIGDLFAEASFDNFVVIKLSHRIIDTVSVWLRESVIGISELVGVINLNQQSIVNGLHRETLILEINLVNRLVE